MRSLKKITIGVVILIFGFVLGYFQGYFQAEKEFGEVRNEVKVQNLKEIEFTPIDKISDEQEAYLAMAKVQKSMAVAIAENGILTKQHTLNQHKELSEYIEQLKKKLPKEEHAEVDEMIEKEKEFISEIEKGIQEDEEFFEFLEEK